MSGTAMCSHPGERSRRSWSKRLILFCATLGASAAAMAQAPNFVAFESGHVRPMALSPDRTRLFVTNTPDNTLEVFDITLSGLALRARVPVGLEPVAVAARNDSEVWVVNHLSDSISVVTLSGTPRVAASAWNKGDGATSWRRRAALQASVPGRCRVW